MSDVLPLRMIIYQLLFIVLAIAVEALVLQRYLGIGRKASIQYASTANLLSTVVGWFIFFVSEPWMPDPLRQQFITYIFFDETNNPPLLVGLAFLMFLGTFFVKLQSLNWLDLILEGKPATTIEVRDRTKFQGRKAQQRPAFANIPNRALAVLWANAASFTVISIVILIRTFSEQPVTF